MTVLLWVRTKRHVETLEPEIDRLRLSLLPYCNMQSYEWLEPFVAGDHVLFGMRSTANIHSLKAFIAPEMSADFIVDWSLTDVGTGLGPYEAHLAEHPDGTIYRDDRFHDPDEDADDATKMADELGYSRLDWGLPYDVHGATALWVALARDREENDFLVRRVERCLPRPYQRLWQGRSAILFAYTSQHDISRPAPYGISDGLGDVLDDEQVDWFLAFQVGNWSIGGAVDNMNPMADWIWRRRRHGKPRLTKKANPARF